VSCVSEETCASEVTTIWRYTNVYIIIIIISIGNGRGLYWFLAIVNLYFSYVILKRCANGARVGCEYCVA